MWDDQSVGLLASLVQRNVDDLAWTNERINEYDERVKQELANTIVKLAKGIEAIPDMIRSSYLDELLWQNQVGITQARDIVRNQGS